jgi:DNA polymerase-1
MKTYLVDYEFRHDPGLLPRPWCVVALCCETHEVVRIWLDGEDVACPFSPPYRLVAHYALAELSCHIALGWPMPDEVIDTLAEARTVRGQCSPSGGWGLLSVASSLGTATMSTEHKESMRALAMGDAVPTEQREELLDYCQADVETVASVWYWLESSLDFPMAALRGRYLIALAKVEHRGIPVDVELVALLRAHASTIKNETWKSARLQYPGAITEKDTFSSTGWLQWCATSSIPWPLLPSDAPSLDEDTFKEMADRYPEVRTMAYARKLRAQSRGFTFPVGDDGRLRCMLSPFGSDTGRNQPSNSHYIFGASAWLRSIIQAPPGRVLVYLDYASQEFALAAALSGDRAMMADYRSGDPYWAFALRAGAVPHGATKENHPGVRATYKVAALSIQYGMGEHGLARRNGISQAEARRLIQQHKTSYPQFWIWRQAVIDTVLCGGSISTRFGWTRKARAKDKSTSIANFPIQAAGAEILRIAVIALEEAGHRVVATIHDAVLVEMDVEGWEVELPQVQDKLSRAARVIAPEIEIRTDFNLIMPGEHFVDSRGVAFWDLVSPIIGRSPLKAPSSSSDATAPGITENRNLGHSES